MQKIDGKLMLYLHFMDKMSQRFDSGNDGFGYHETEHIVKTPNPVIEAEAQYLVNIVTNRSLPKWKREKAYQKLAKQYGAYIEQDDAEFFCSRDTDSEESDPEPSEPSESDSESSDLDSLDDAELFCSCDADSDDSELASDDSEQCPEKSSDAVASQSMGQQLSPDKTDSKGE
jgi:hypothetical protein